MAGYVKLTEINTKKPLWINTEQVAFFMGHQTGTVIYFVGGKGDTYLTSTVAEDPEIVAGAVRRLIGVIENL